MGRVSIQVLAFGFLVFICRHGDASSPGMIEGPPGCTWEAKVAGVEGSAMARKVRVELKSIHGTCVGAPCPAGKSGEVLSIPLQPENISPKKGEKLKVFVDSDTWGKPRARLDLPACWRKKIK